MDRGFDRYSIKSLSPGVPRGLCPLPLLAIADEHEFQIVQNSIPLPWWAEPYVPPSYRGKMSVRPRRDGQQPPEVIAGAAGGVAASQPPHSKGMLLNSATGRPRPLDPR